MIGLVVGLMIFLGTHSIRVAAPAWRTQQIARHGDRGWRTSYSVASALGLIAIVWGFHEARSAPVTLWNPPVRAHYATAILVLGAFILNAASGVPGNRIKGFVRHPMLAAIALWGSAHLISNGGLADLLLFGSFIGWAMIDFRSCLNRDRMAGIVAPVGTLRADLVCVLAGVVTWAIFLLFLHRWLFGVSPLF